jgi:hypothetical protein
MVRARWLTVTSTADSKVREAVQHIDALDGARQHADGQTRKAQRTNGTRRSAGYVRLGPPALKHKNPAEVGRPAPGYHRKLAKRRDTAISHPMRSEEVGDITAVAHQRFPRFQNRDVGHPDDFSESLEGNVHVPCAPVLHAVDRGLEYGSPRIGASPRGWATDRPKSCTGSVSRDQTTTLIVREAKPPPLTRAASLALAVRGWHAVERGTLPGGPSIARRKFEHLPPWEATSRAKFSREQAELMLEDGLAGRPSALGLTSSARPSSTGGQLQLKHPRRHGEDAPAELGKTTSSSSRSSTRDAATASLPPPLPRSPLPPSTLPSALSLSLPLPKRCRDLTVSPLLCRPEHAVWASPAERG